MEHLMSLKEAAEKWNVTERTVRKWCMNNTINAVKIDGTWVVVSNQNTSIQSFDEFKISGLSKAVKNFNDYYDVARIYFDHDNHFVWTAYFTNEDEMHFYNHISAVEVYNKVFHENFCRQATEEQILMLCYDAYLAKEFTSFDDLQDYTPPYLVE